MFRDALTGCITTDAKISILNRHGHSSNQSGDIVLKAANYESYLIIYDQSRPRWWFERGLSLAAPFVCYLLFYDIMLVLILPSHPLLGTSVG